MAREQLHYYHTPKEMDGLTGKGPGTHDHDSALCGYGSFHFARTRDRSAVTCPRCCEKLGLPVPVPNDEYPRLEKNGEVEVPRLRKGRPGYVWVQGWSVHYSPTRVSTPEPYAAARGALEEALQTKESPTT